MTLDDALNNRQPYACAFKFFTMKALEDTEKLVIISHIEPDTIILQTIDNLVCIAITADFNDARFSVLCKLDGIREKVDEYLPYERLIAICRQYFCDFEFELAVPYLLPVFHPILRL